MKILDKGYWVSNLFYIRSLVHWFLSSIRFQSITFFSAVNPALHLGGMLDDRKSDVYVMLPEYFLPKMLVVSPTDDNIPELLKENSLQFPLIVKPDVGYKGYLVRRVENNTEMKDALTQYGERKALIQEFLNHPREFSLFYYRLPKSGKQGVSSFVEKILPYVIGDGKSTLRELINKSASAFLDKKYVLNKKVGKLDLIIPKGQKEIIDHVGNISRGSKFYSMNEEIDDAMIESSRQLFSYLDGINFGRVDLKANSVEDVKKGNFKVIEINGAKSEPLHMYEPSMPWNKVWKIISDHWVILNSIVSEQLSSTYHLPSAKDGIAAAKSFKKQTTS
ncbi:MAG: hypothetical protein V3V00_08290 [Saprospiraceae bacterium]